MILDDLHLPCSRLSPLIKKKKKKVFVLTCILREREKMQLIPELLVIPPETEQLMDFLSYMIVSLLNEANLDVLLRSSGLREQL